MNKSSKTRVSNVIAVVKTKTPPHEKTFSSFRIAKDVNGHYIEARDHTMRWFADKRRFKKFSEFRTFYEYELGMVLYEDGPYLADDQHPKKPACWSGHVASKLKLSTTPV